MRRPAFPRNWRVAESALVVLLLAVPAVCLGLFWVGSAGEDPDGDAERGLVAAGLWYAPVVDLLGGNTGCHAPGGGVAICAAGMGAD